MPVPVPSVVLVASDISGPVLVLHTTPLAVTAAPPSTLMVPPLNAVVAVIDEAAVVLNVGNPIGFLKIYGVPTN